MPAEVIVPADGQKAVIAELNYLHAGSASGKIPKPVPDLFYRVLPAGGFDRDLVTTVPNVIVESWGLDADEASDRILEAIAYLQRASYGGSLGGIVCYEVRVISLPSSLPSSTMPDHHRYSATISAALRSAVV